MVQLITVTRWKNYPLEINDGSIFLLLFEERKSWTLTCFPLLSPSLTSDNIPIRSPKIGSLWSIDPPCARSTQRSAGTHRTTFVGGRRPGRSAVATRPSIFIGISSPSSSSRRPYCDDTYLAIAGYLMWRRRMRSLFLLPGKWCWCGWCDVVWWRVGR